MTSLEEGIWHESHVVWHLPPSVCVHVTHGTWKIESKFEESERKCHAPILSLTRLADSNRVRGARTYTGTLYLLNQTLIYPSLIIYQHIIYKSPK